MKNLVLFISVVLIISCEASEGNINKIKASQDEWSVSKQFLKEGTPFELMNTPNFKTVQEISSLSDDSKVALVSFKNEVRVYPYRYTNQFEIINDTFDGNFISISYCPITQSAICFNREVNGKIYNLIASGYLFKDNMVPSDENLIFFISQMLMKGIKGEIANKQLDHFNLIETKWKTVKTYFPNAMVFFHNNSKKKSNKGNTSKKSSFAYGILNTEKTTETVELFQLDYFSKNTTSTTKNINQNIAIIIGNEEKKIFASYYVPNNKSLHLLDEDQFPNIIADTKGNIYNIFGYAISGPDTGLQLKSPKAYVAQLWAWKDFYEDININN